MTGKMRNILYSITKYFCFYPVFINLYTNNICRDFYFKGSSCAKIHHKDIPSTGIAFCARQLL